MSEHDFTLQIVIEIVRYILTGDNTLQLELIMEELKDAEVH